MHVSSSTPNNGENRSARTTRPCLEYRPLSTRRKLPQRSVPMLLEPAVQARQFGVVLAHKRNVNVVSVLFKPSKHHRHLVPSLLLKLIPTHLLVSHLAP